MLTEETEPSIN